MSKGFLGMEEDVGQIYNPQAADMATRLKSIVETKLKFRVSWSLESWSATFRLLIKDHGQATVERVLSWYDIYCEGSPKYKVKSAKAFRKSFESFESLCDEATKMAKPAVMSDVGMQVAARLRAEFRWPAVADKKLDAAVEQSLTNYIAYRKKLRALKGSTKDRMLGFFLDYSTPELIRLPEEFVFGWFYHIHESVKNWKTWSGDLENRIFTEDCERLDNFGTDLAASFGDRRLWQKLATLVKGMS